MTQQQSITVNGFLARPELASRFDVIKVIGEGAAGVVYLVRDSARQGQAIALKILARDGAFDENTIVRFKNEFKICQRIRHSNIIEAYDFFDLQDTAAFTMEYVDGADLGKIFRERKLTSGQIEMLFDQLLDAVEELHKHNVLHRDIKMENVLVRRDGIVKLSDLGLMKQWQRNLTKTGVLLGTAHYFPPEYVREGKYDERSEIYTLGVMLYELLSGDRWLRDLPGNRAIEHLIKTQFAFPLDSLPDVPQKLLTVLEKALKYKAMHRFQSVGEMKAVLRGALPETLAGSGKLVPWEEERRPSALHAATETRAAPSVPVQRRSPIRKLLFLLWITLSMAILAVGTMLLLKKPAGKPSIAPPHAAPANAEESTKFEGEDFKRDAVPELPPRAQSPQKGRSQSPSSKLSPPK